MSAAGCFLATWRHKLDPESECKMIMRRRTLSLLGGALPVIPLWLMQHVRNHLDQHYCSTCGEYIYNPYVRRKIRHYHAIKYRQRYNPILNQRLLIRPQSRMIEWTRRFPHVLRLVLSMKQISSGHTKILPRRTMSCRLWTIQEWNLFYPSLLVRETGLLHLDKHDPDILFVPDITFF